MRILKIGCLVLVVMFGIFLVVFGEKDDSPGAQGLGLILTLAGAWNIRTQYK
jgi:hypothetical protein